MTSELVKRIKAEKYGGNALTYQTTNDDLDILSGLSPYEERQIYAAAKEQIDQEEKDAQEAREQRQIDRHREAMNSREHCPDCSKLLGFQNDALAIHRKSCNFYMERIMNEEKAQKLHDGHISRYNYVFDRLNDLTSEMSRIKQLLSDIKFKEIEANHDRTKGILQAAQEQKTTIMNESKHEREKRYQIIKDLDNFTNTLEQWYLRLESTKEEEKEEAQEKVGVKKSVQSR